MCLNVAAWMTEALHPFDHRFFGKQLEELRQCQKRY